MPVNQEALLYTLTGFADVFYTFFMGEPQDVTFKYMDQNGNVKSVTVPNIAKAKQSLEKSAVTDKELEDALKNYYKKVEVDEIRNAILDKFKDYYKKSEVDGKITAVKADYAKKINDAKTALDHRINDTNDKIAATKTELEGKITIVDNRTVMTEAEYQALVEARRKMYAGSGVVEFGNTYAGLTDPYRFTLKDLWNHSWPGCCNFRDQTDPNKYAHYGYTAKMLHWSREGWSYIGGSINPVLNVNGHRIVIRGINQSKAFESCVKNVIEFPEAPTAKAIIIDSTSLPVDMKQGDFAILKDLDRELVVNGTFESNIDGWRKVAETGGNFNIVHDSSNNSLKLQVNSFNNDAAIHAIAFTNIGIDNNKLIKKVKYRISLDVVDFTNGVYVDIRKSYVDQACWARGYEVIGRINKTGHYEFEFELTGNEKYLSLTFNFNSENASIKIDNVSIKQVEETPIVALYNVNHHVDVYQNVDKFEGRDSISRRDLVFLEVWDENISEKDFVYPYGNVQYQGNNVDSVPGITEGRFDGYGTYSLFGTWQEPGALVGKGYVWSKLSEEDKIKLASNPNNNIRRKGNEWIQTRYRVRVVKGLGNSWRCASYDCQDTDGMLAYTRGSTNFTVRPQGKATVPTSNYDLANSHSLAFVSVKHGKDAIGYTFGVFGTENRADNEDNDPIQIQYRKMVGGTVYALPIALVQRRNDGIYNKIFNPEGTAQAYDKNADKLLEFGEYALDDSFVTSLADCFNISKITAKTKNGNVVPADDSSAVYRSGYIMSGISGHEAGLFADEINERDVEDLRMYAEKKPYKEILDEYLQKAITGNIRGKERMSFLKKYIIYRDGGNHNYLRDYKTRRTYDLTQHTQFIRNNHMVPFINVTRGRRFDIGVMLYNYNIDHRTGYTTDMASTTTNYKDDIVFVPDFKSYVQNNTVTQTDIIGDPRKLKDRVSVTVTSENETLSTLKHNTYVYCANGSDNNKGTTGHYYRYMGPNLTNIDTNSTNGDANANNGHINFSDTDKWLDLGTNGEIGGYPDTWLEKGFQGIPLLVGENGESLLPIEARIYPGPNNDATIGFDDSNKGFYVKLTKKLKRLRRVSVRKKDGSWLDYELVWYNKPLHAATGNGWKSEAKNRVYVNLSDESLTVLGYSSLQEALDLMQIVVVYDAYANFLEITSNTTKPVEVSDDVYASNYNFYSYGQPIANNLLNKVMTGSIAGITVHGWNNKTGQNAFQTNNYYYITHEEFDKTRNFGGRVAAKWITALTNSNNRAHLQFIFKEMKFSSDPKLTIRPGVYLNNKYLGGGRRSYTVAYFNTAGELIDIENFDTYGNGNEATRMTNYLNNIPDNSIVAISSYDEPRKNVVNNDNLKAAMAKCGANTDILSNLEYRSSYALIGIKTGQAQGTKLVESYSPRFHDPIRVEYKTDDFVIRVESRGLNTPTTLDKSASWGDDNKFQIVNSVRIVTDLNGEKVLVGQKRVALPYFIID